MKKEMFNYVDVYATLMGRCTIDERYYKGTFNNPQKAYDFMGELLKAEYGQLGEVLIHDTIEDTMTFYFREKGQIVEQYLD